MAKRLTVYRKCACGETAFDYTGFRDVLGYLVYACRNCKAQRIPLDKRSLRLRDHRPGQAVTKSVT